MRHVIQFVWSVESRCHLVACNMAIHMMGKTGTCFELCETAVSFIMMPAQLAQPACCVMIWWSRLQLRNKQCAQGM